MVLYVMPTVTPRPLLSRDMGTTRFWLLLIAAQIIVLVILAALGPTTVATPLLRYTGFACLAGIFACIPPLVIKLFVAAQLRIGNGAQPMVQTLQQHQTGITFGVWSLIVVALVMALPRIRADIAADNVAALSAAAAASAPAADSTMGISTNPLPGDALPVGTTAADTTRADTTPVLTPGAGSKTRTAILDALRYRLKMNGRFRVDHIRTYNSWAFVRATEVVELDKGELQETDLTVSALLELPANSTIAAWRIVELWTLPDNDKLSMADFMRGVRAKQRTNHLPNALFPDDLLSTPQ